MSVIIRLKNLPMTAGASDVRTFFSGLKIPDGAVHIIGGDEGEVFVGFSSDEDARIAMTKNGDYIHDSEIRLLLSSKSEQNAVIQARKNGTYQAHPPPTAPENFSPPINHPPPQSTRSNQPSGNPYAARGGYEASYPPINTNAPPDFQIQNKFNDDSPKDFRGFPNDAPPMNSPPRREPQYGKFEDYGYNRNFQQGSQPPVGRFQGGPRGQEQKPAPMQQRTEGPPQLSPNKGTYGYRGGPPERNQGPQSGGMQSGESWRDNSYPQSGPLRRNDYGRGNKLTPHHNQMGPSADVPSTRKTLMPTPKMNFPPSNVPPRPFQNGPPQGGPPVNLPPQNIPAPFQNILNSQNAMNRGGPPSQVVPPGARNHPPPFQNGPPPLSKLSVPILPPQPVITPEKFYIELTRLPNDLLRPASLEAFIHPTVPLTLSSVKTVYGPGGIHMHTIIRLDSIADYAMMMRRNGEQGIKIQPSDKKSFDSAEDGAPVAVFPSNVTPAEPAVSPKPSSKKDKKDDDSNRRRSRWGDKSPQKENPRRERRSRSPHRKRRRSRSPRRREEHTDPTRWCIQVTNVPFRMKDEELLEWFAEKVKPAKLSRTYYSDGNASDRWVAEFSSESLMRRAFSIRSLCHGRTLKMSYIDNEKADEILKIEDVYGKEKRQINEEARILQEEAEKANPPSFFNQPTVIPRGTSVNSNQAPPAAPVFNSPPNRGGFASRGSGFPPRGGMMGGPPRGGNSGGAQPFFQNGPSAFNSGGPAQGEFRGGYHGGSFRGGRGGGRGGYHGKGGAGGFREEPTRSEFMELVQSIGPRGTVLSCNGFPRDVTLEDVVDFFGNYDPDRNSIRIRRGDDGVMTGECMLACFHPDDALQAARELDGQSFRNSVISVQIL